MNRNLARIERINVNQDYEFYGWAADLGVSPGDLRRAIAEVGPIVADVRKHLDECAARRREKLAA